MTNRSIEYKIKDGKEYINKTEIEADLLYKQLQAKEQELDKKYADMNNMAKAVRVWEAELREEINNKENQLLTIKTGKL